MLPVGEDIVAENIADITAGIHELAGQVANRYAAIERRYRFRAGLILSFALLEILV